MAYNAISGTIIAAQHYLPASGSIVANVVSGNLSTSDGASIINVPRVSNATNNAIVTNVDGDANQLFCETNLTFDGTTLAVTGDVSASVNISASYFYGDGSRLSGISTASGRGPVSSIQIHTGSGGLSGSESLVFSSNVLQIGGGLRLRRRTVTSTITASVGDYFIGTNSTGGAFEIRLLAASDLSDGQVMVFKDESGTSDTNNVTILASGSQTIDGQNSVVLESPNASVQLYCDGISKYFIF